MIITASTQLYNQDLTLFTGKQRNRLNGSEFNALIAGGYDFLLYTAPTYDSATQKLGDVVSTGPFACTKEVINKSQAELDAELLAERQLMSLTARQFRRGLLNYPGKLQQVEDYIALQSDEDKVDWAHGGTIDRLYPLTVAMIAELGFTDEQADNFFRTYAGV